MKSNASLLLLPFLIIFHDALPQEKKAPEKTNIQQSSIDPLDHYIAQITAASALLELNEVGEAKKFLAATNQGLQNWEWNYLNAKADQSQLTLTSHTKGVVSIDVNPEAKLMASGSADNTIKVWSLTDKKEMITLTGHEGSVTSLDFNVDGKLLVSGSRDKSVIIWDVAAGKQKMKINEGLSQGIYNVKFSPDGQWLLVCSWERVKKDPPIAGFGKIFEVATGKEIKRFDMCPKPVTSGAFSNDGKKILLAGWDFNTISYDIESGKQLWENNISNDPGYTAILSLDLSPDGKKVAISSRDNRIRVLDAENGKLLKLIDSVSFKRDINGVRFTADGKYIISGAEDGFVKVWNAETGKLYQSYRGHSNIIHAVAAVPGAPENAAVSASQDGTIKWWDLDAEKAPELTVCNNGPWDMPLSPDEKRIAASCSDKILNVWEVASGKIIASFPDQASNCSAFTSDGKMLVSAAHDQMVRVFDIDQQKQVRALQSKGSLYGVAVSKEKNLLATISSAKFVQVWKLDDGAEVKSLAFEEGGGQGTIRFCAQKNWVIASSGSGYVKIWNINDWSVVKVIPVGIASANFQVNREGTRMLVGNFASTDEPLFFDLDKMEKIFSLNGHTAEVNALSISPDGSRLVTGSYDQTIRVWDAKSGKCVLTIRNLPSIVYCLSHRKSGKEIIYSMTEGQIRSVGFEP